MFGNNIPTHIMEKDSRDDDLLVAFYFFQKFYGIAKRDLGMDEVLSGPQERFRPLKNLLINQFHPSNFKFSTLNSKMPSSFYPEDKEDQYLNPSKAP